MTNRSFPAYPRTNQQSLNAPITGPATGRDISEVPGQPPDTTVSDGARVAAELAAGKSFVVPTPPHKIFYTGQILVPGSATNGGAADFNLQSDYDWIAFYFPTAPGALLSGGPNAPIWPFPAAGFLVFPCTTRNYKFLNTNAAAYTVLVMVGAGFPPPTFTAI